MLFSFKLSFPNSHWTADTHTRGKLGNGDAGLMPSVQKHIKGPSGMVETYSRSTREQTAEMVNVGRTWGPGRGGLDSRVEQQQPSFLHSFSSTWNRPSSHGLSISCPFPQAHPKYPLPWNHPGLIPTCWVPKALFTPPISHEGPSYSASSSVHGFSQLLARVGVGVVRSVHQALGWTLTLIISNLHNKLTGSPGPTSQMSKFTKWGHITGLRMVNC